MLLNKWWVSLIFFFTAGLPWPGLKKSLKPVCASGADRRKGALNGPGALLVCFCLCFFCPFSFLPTPNPPTPPPPPHTHILVSWRLNPEGRDLLSHTITCGPKSTWRFPVAFVLCLSSPFLAHKAATVAEMHSRANTLKSTYLVQEPEGQFLWVGKWYRDCREEIKKKNLI